METSKIQRIFGIEPDVAMLVERESLLCRDSSVPTFRTDEKPGLPVRECGVQNATICHPLQVFTSTEPLTIRDKFGKRKDKHRFLEARNGDCLIAVIGKSL